jgi:hypothetical protein
MAFGLAYIHTQQVLAATGDGAGGALGTASGFAATSLGDGTVEKSWRGSASATSHTIALDLTDATWDAIALLDARATDGTAPTSATLAMSATGLSGTWTGAEAIPLNGDGDGWLAPAGTIRRYVRITVAFASAKTLRIGEVFAGSLVTLTRAYTGRRDSHDWHALENQTPAGTRSVARLAGRSRVLSLEWDALLSAERAEFVTLWSTTVGGTLPVVLVPNVDASTDVLHGTIPAVWSEDIDVLYTGISFDFTQSGRSA